MTRRRQRSGIFETDGEPVQLPQLHARRRGWRPLSSDGLDQRFGCSECGRPMGMIEGADQVSGICSMCQIGVSL